MMKRISRRRFLAAGATAAAAAAVLRPDLELDLVWTDR